MKHKLVCIIGVILALTLIVAGFVISVPDRTISSLPYAVNGYKEYVGGDAYNIQIEASLRGGEIAGAKAEKAIYISSGVILLFLSFAFEYCFDAKQKKDKSVVASANDNVQIS